MNPENHISSDCPECNFFEDASIARRDFMKMMGGTAALASVGALPALAAKPSRPKPAEDLIRELHATLSKEQRSDLVLPWNEGGGKGKIPTRMGMYNRALFNAKIGDHYKKPQQELVERILKSICSDEEGFRKLTRNGKFDSSKSLEGCGAHIFGDPSGKGQFAWVFTGHHLTVRCDGNSLPGAAFGGPMYYGHVVNGYSEKNVYHYQTKAVQSVFDALSGKQQAAAIAMGSPGEQAKSVKHRERPYPGIGLAELSKDQQALVRKVMRAVLGPFRKEDGDEVMEIVKANGGLDKINLAFYKDQKAPADKKVRWHFWRLEGPGFVWNYRVLGHVHCFVNIAKV